MIYTCTLNPSVDYLLELDQVTLGALNRAGRTFFYPGGKGINVARVLKRLGSKSTALGYVGGFTGDFIEHFLEQEGVSTRFIKLEAPTRINIKLKAGQETEINGSGISPSVENQQQLLQIISSLTKQDLLVLAGSLPPAVPSDFYSTIARVCSSKGVSFVVDASGPALEHTLSQQPFLIKPNQQEIGELLHVEVRSVDDALRCGTELLEKGAKNVIVSMGAKGAVLVSQEVAAYARAPKGEVKNSVGAGDSTVAGFLASYKEDQDVLQAFRYGVAAGSATAFSLDLCSKSRVDELAEQIQVEIFR